MRTIAIALALAVAAPARAEKCVTPAQGKKLQKATEARNRGRYLRELGKQGKKPVTLKSKDEPAPMRESTKKVQNPSQLDPFAGPIMEVEEHDGDVVEGEVLFTVRDPVCGSGAEFQFATDKAGDVFVVYSDIERSDRPEPLVCGCEPPSGGCGIVGDKNVLYRFKLPRGAKFKGSTKVSYTADDAYLQFTNTGCKPKQLPQ